MKKLPIGIQTFKNLIEEGYYYVDKTRFIKRLVDEGKYYFLSRPRRFGKSLFLSTIKSAFLGQKELFRELHLEDNWDWDQSYPVVDISFGSGVMRHVEDLGIRFGTILDNHSAAHQIRLKQEDLRERFFELLQKINKKYNCQIVVLIDEYDKPILDNIDNPETALAIREELKNLYSIIKDSDPYMKLVLITGVTKFSKVSLFSGLNNLNDISLDESYSPICGYTQTELVKVFSERLQDVDLDELKNWYNGYNWSGDEVYNPFNILLYLSSKEFRNYWFETGSPSFLIKLLHSGKYFIPEIQEFTAGEEIVGSFDIDNINAETLLFQTGYLTIKKIERIGAFRRYSLSFPNLEVKAALTNSILGVLVEDRLAKARNQSDVLDALLNNDFDKLKQTVHSFFAFIPQAWYRKNQLSGYEEYYASIVYCYFAALGLDVRPEESTNKGLIDLVIRFEGRVYVIEFKVVELSESSRALDQIKKKGYAEKFSQPTYLLGIEFSSKERNIVRFEWEKMTQP